MDELNPNHPVTRALNSEWHKLCAAILLKFGLTEISLTEADLVRMERPEGTNIIAHAKEREIVLKIVGDKEAERLAKKAGGLPI